MAQTCCGCFAFIFFLIIIYLVVKIILSTVKTGKIKSTETTSLQKLLDMQSQLAKNSQYMELKGSVVIEKPIQTPYSRIECAYYDFKVTQYWTTPGGEDDVDHNKQVHRSVAACSFYLTDGKVSIPVIIDGGLEINIETEAEQELRIKPVIEDESIIYENMPGNAYDISYEYTEQYLPAGKRVYFIGNVKYEEGVFHLQHGGGIALFSDKSEKRLVNKDLNDRATSIRLLFLCVICFALCFIAVYGKPEGLADTLRNIVEFVVEVIEEAD